MIILIRKTDKAWLLDTTGTPAEQRTLKATGTTWVELPFTVDSNPEKVRLVVEHDTGETVTIL